MRRSLLIAGVCAAAAGIVAVAPRARGATWTGWLVRAAWDWAGVPSGPLGWMSSRVMPWFHGPIYPVMARALDLQPDDDLLEVACGSGVFLAEQAGAVRRVTGLDLSEPQLALARRRLADRIADGTAVIVKGDAAALPFDDDRFSAVTCMGSMEAFPDPQGALTEMYRVLRPGGRVAVSIGSRVAAGTETHQALGAVWVWTEADALRLVEDAGFTGVSASYERWAGSSGVLALVNRLGDTQEARIVCGVKAPADVAPDETVVPSRSPAATDVG